MKVQVVVVLAVICILAAQESPQIYCGRRLASTLAVLCYKDYKRSRSIETLNFDLKPNYYDSYGFESGYVSPWLAVRAAQGLHGARSKRQVVSECCDKACTIEELMSYCG